MSNEKLSPGLRLKQAMQSEKPLAVVGTINAYSALLAQEAGFNAIYLSGAGVANASFGLPDLGITTLDNVLEDTRRITAISDLPLIVDADTGFTNVALTTTSLIDAGAAAMQIEDQVEDKRCGHRPGKVLVTPQEMQSRIKAAVSARTDKDFSIIARTDAYAVEGLDAAMERANDYITAGADMIFAEALTDIDEYRAFAKSIGVPLIANITEFGKTPLFNQGPLASAGVQVALYPLTAFRAMSQAALNTYKALRKNGTQSGFVDDLQTRDELYNILNYKQYEQAVDEKLSQPTADGDKGKNK
jgi:methylisocitrate lyase